jgi:hypothetical protein
MENVTWRGGPQRSLVLLAVALAAVAASYHEVRRAEFVWDDHPLIAQHPPTHEIRPLHEYFRRQFWSDPSSPDVHGYYRPLVSLSYALEWQLWQGRPTGFHVTNVLIHLGCCALGFALARRAGAKPAAAALGALLFGIFPRLTESVAWISGRTDPLAALFTLSALWLHRSGPGHTRSRVAAGGALWAGLMCKEVALAGGLAIAARELARRRDTVTPWSRTLTDLMPTMLAVGAWGLLRALAWAPDVEESSPIPFAARLSTLPLEALGSYAAMLLDPLRPQILIGVLGRSNPYAIALGVPVAAGLAALAWRAWRRWEAGSVMLCTLGLAALFPVLHVLPFPTTVVAADRFLYLPVAALSIGLAAASARLPSRLERPIAVAALLVAGLFSLATLRQVAVWTNDLELWRHGIERAPHDHPLPYAHLGYAYASRAQPEPAVAAYRRALEIEATYPVAGRAPSARIRANLALALSETGETDEALRLMREVLSAQPGFASHYLQMAAIESRALQFEAAEASLLRVLALVPNHSLAESLLGLVRETRSRFEALPAPKPDEPLAIVAERAAVMAMAGRIRAADALWKVVVEDPDAPLPLLYKAAAHFASVGYQPQAGRAAFRRLQDIGADPIRIARLEERLVGRKLVD